MLDNLPVFCILPPDTAGCSAVSRPGTGRQKKGREGERPLSLWGPGPGAGRESRRRLATGLHLACNGLATGLQRACIRLGTGLHQACNHRAATVLPQCCPLAALGLPPRSSGHSACKTRPSAPVNRPPSPLNRSTHSIYQLSTASTPSGGGTSAKVSLESSCQLPNICRVRIKTRCPTGGTPNLCTYRSVISL